MWVLVRVRVGMVESNESQLWKGEGLGRGSDQDMRDALQSIVHGITPSHPASHLVRHLLPTPPLPALVRAHLHSTVSPITTPR